MIFSMFDMLALIVVVLTLYRFRLKDCVWPSIFVAGIMSLQSFMLREELALADLVPFIHALLIALLLTVILQVPFHWSVLGTFGGYFLYILLQASVAELSGTLFGLSIEDIKDSPSKGYAFQIIVAMIAYFACKFLYSRGIGFATNFKKRFKYESVIVAAAIVSATLLFGVLLLKQEVLLDLIVVAVAMVFFLIILIKKELS